MCKRVPVHTLGITQRPITGSVQNPRPTTFLRFFQEQHKYSKIQLHNCIHFSQVFRCIIMTLNMDLEIEALLVITWIHQTTSTPLPNFLPCCTAPKYLLDRMCISFSEMYLSLGLNKLSGKNRKQINFRRYRTTSHWIYCG